MRDKLLIYYHGISERWASPLGRAAERFEEHLWLVAKRGYKARTFLDAMAASDPAKYPAVSFDDGTARCSSWRSR